MATTRGPQLLAWLPHTGAVQVVEKLWHVAVPLAVVAVSAAVLLRALVRREPLGLARRDWVVAGLVLLTLAGAAFGDHRPLFERQWKGTAAALFGLALGVELWRHHGERRRAAACTPAAPPAPLDAPVTGAAGPTRPAGKVTGAVTTLAAGETVVLTMPHLGQRDSEGTVIRWSKDVGEAVETDEPLLEVSTDKVDAEIPSPATGTLLEIKVFQDETVRAGVALAVIGVVPRK